jgi:hypothetical protein
MKKKTIILCFLSLWLCSFVYAQSEIQGKVIDAKTKELIAFATISTTINGKPISVQTDFDGYYSIRPLPEGTYDVTITYVGYGTRIINCVETKANRITFLEVELTLEAIILEEVIIPTNCYPYYYSFFRDNKELVIKTSRYLFEKFTGINIAHTPQTYKLEKFFNDIKENDPYISILLVSGCRFGLQTTNSTNNAQPTNEAAQVSEEQAKTNTTAQITCFPNPTFDQLNIALKDNIAEIRLVNTEGKVIERYNTQNKKHLQIDMSHYCKGTYFVQYNIGSHHTSHKIVLLH